VAIIDLEFTEQTFTKLVWALVAGRAAVPFGTLESLGPDRLIGSVAWPKEPVFETAAVPGVSVRPGELLLRYEVQLSHVSVNELRLNPSTPGVPESGQAWFLVSSSVAGMKINFVAYSLVAGTVQKLTSAQTFGLVALPELPVKVFRTAVVRDGMSVALRLGTAFADNLLSGPGGFLAARNAAGEDSATWGLHIPEGVFLQLIGTQLDDALAGLGSNITVEDPLSINWRIQDDGKWGVSATVGLLKQDACPGIFGSVSISVELRANASFTPRTDTSNHLDIRLVTATAASDWDSFRCFLGSGGVITGLTALINPFLALGVGVGTLVMIGDVISDEAVKPLHEKSRVGPLTKVSDTSDGAIYSQSINLPTKPVPGTLEQTLRMGPNGLDLFGSTIIPPLQHAVAFAPKSGNLSGVDWRSRINCSLRSIDWTFSFKPIWVTDTVTAYGFKHETIPVYPFTTTTSDVLGTGAGLVEVVGSTMKVGGGLMRPGDTGWLVLHTTAGVRLFTLGPVPAQPVSPDIKRVIDKFCDTQHVLVAVIDIPQLKFEAPKPMFEYGFEALQQWQFVLGDLREDTQVVVAQDGRELLSSTRLAVEGGRAVGQVVTAGSAADLSVRGSAPFGFAAAHRWLVPFAEIQLPSPARSLTQQDGGVVVHTALDGAFQVDSLTYELTPFVVRAVPLTLRQPALAVTSAVVATVHEGRLMMTFPSQTQVSGTPQG
jgi:hypothetical protein